MEPDRIIRPTLLLDKNIAIANIRRIVDKCRSGNVILRPHFKTHQSKMVGRWFRDAGIERITVSSVSMADYFISDGWKDVTIAFPYNPREHHLIESLAQRARLTLTIPGLDSASIIARQARSNLDIMIKVDTGYNRSGTAWDNVTAAGRIIEEISGNSNLHIRGLLTHAGNTYKSGSPEKVISDFNESRDRILLLRERLGLSDLIVSVGDTPSASLADDFTGIDELRPGNLVFYDLTQQSAGVCRLQDIAVAMACPVVENRNDHGTIVIYGGSVHLSKESININGSNVYGQLVELNNNGWTETEYPVYVTSLSQEHGIATIPEEMAGRYKPGDIVGILPVHSCLTADIAGSYMLTDGSRADHLSERKSDSNEPEEYPETW